jgi:hypothetical protein
MEHGVTKTGPIFLQTAQGLVTRLSQDTSEKGRELARRAATLVAVFEAWPSTPPTPEARANTIHQLLDLQRQALEHIAARVRDG